MLEEAAALVVVVVEVLSSVCFLSCFLCFILRFWNHVLTWKCEGWRDAVEKEAKKEKNGYEAEREKKSENQKSKTR